jgi:hypothetical protein
MASKGSQSKQGESARRWDWLLFLLALLVGFICLQVTAQLAVRPVSVWQAPVNMLSQMNPNQGYVAQWRVVVEPLRSEVMTPAWDPASILTPEGKGNVVPPVILAPILTGTPGPRAATAVPTAPFMTATLPPSVDTPVPAREPTDTPAPTAGPTDTPIPTLTLPPTPTPLPPTLTPSPTRQPTLSPTPTAPPPSPTPLPPPTEPPPTEPPPTEPPPTMPPRPPTVAP